MLSSISRRISSSSILKQVKAKFIRSRNITDETLSPSIKPFRSKLRGRGACACNSVNQSEEAAVCEDIDDDEEEKVTKFGNGITIRQNRSTGNDLYDEGRLQGAIEKAHDLLYRNKVSMKFSLCPHCKLDTYFSRSEIHPKIT